MLSFLIGLLPWLAQPRGLFPQHPMGLQSFGACLGLGLAAVVFQALGMLRIVMAICRTVVAVRLAR